MLVLRTAIALGMLCSLGWSQWLPQVSGTTASLRGISAVSEQIAWASGSGGTVLRTTDGGSTWKLIPVPDAQTLDFRAIQAFDTMHAFVMSIGLGAQSRLYWTEDGGAHWSLLVKNQDAAGFFDAIGFWDRRRGVLMGDPVDGRIYIRTTADGGKTWQRVDGAHMPAARPGEGAFAASNTCLVVRGNGYTWIATGGTGGSRVYRSTDWGQTWQASETPMRRDNESSGIFSIVFRDDRHGLAVGGNYSKPAEDRDNFAMTQDGGRTWETGKSRPAGYRSAIVYLPGSGALLAAGTTGTDRSTDGGRSWTHRSDLPFNAMSFAGVRAGWAVGPKGAIAKYAPER